ncbi:Replication factor A protein 1 [Bienertia sinuspersici]
MKKNGKTIKELQDLYNSIEENQRNAIYTCVGMITKYCNKCNITPQFPLYRYPLVVTMYDGETTINVGIFDKDVEKIVGKPITAMMKIYEEYSSKDNGPTRVSKELQQCIGKKCTRKHELQSSMCNNENIIENLTYACTDKGQSKPDLHLQADIATAVRLSMEEHGKKGRQTTRRSTTKKT